MVNDWEETTLGDICEKVVTGGTPLTSNKDFYTNAKVPWLKTKEVNFCRIYETENYISQLGLEKSSAKLIPPNSVIIAMYGQGDTAGRVAINKISLATNQACCNLIVDNNIACYQYVYFYLKNSYSELVRRKTGSAQPNLNTKILKEFEITLPPLPEQKAIAHILGSLDDKIELNRQMNETLEAMAQALFKSWFVDFDPVIDNAIAAGNTIPDELLERAEQRKAIEKKDSSDIQDLFPDDFEFTEEMGWIPKGWEVTSLGKHMKFQTGPAFKSAEFAETGVKLARGDNVKEGRFQWGNKTRYWSHVDESLEKYLLKSGDVLIGMDGSKVGKNRTRVTESDLPCLLVQRVAKLSKKNTICSNFIFLVINSQYFRDYVDVIKTGSAIPHISGGQIKDLKIILPKNNDNPIFAKFEEFASAFINRIDSNVYDSKTLAKLRDTLLPKLMSGELRISDAAAIVDEAI